MQGDGKDGSKWNDGIVAAAAERLASAEHSIGDLVRASETGIDSAVCGCGVPDCTCGDRLELVGVRRVARFSFVADSLERFGMIRAGCLLLVCLACFCVGCEDSVDQYYALPAPAAEHPVFNPPLAIRQSNWLGGANRNEGSCVHASLSSMLHWQNQFDKAAQWRSTYSGGEYDTRLRERLNAAGIPHIFTNNSSIDFLDLAHASRRGSLLWWKPSHCCTFCGWVKGDNGQIYAVILDNNRVGAYELVEKSQFHRLWAGYGGFALSTLYDPASPPVYRSYAKKVSQSAF